jgi:hypothetical protein
MIIYWEILKMKNRKSNMMPKLVILTSYILMFFGIKAVADDQLDFGDLKIIGSSQEFVGQLWPK